MAVTEYAARAGHDTSGLAQGAVCLAVAAAGADFTGLALFDRAGGAAMVAACRHRTEAWAQVRIPPGEGLAGRVLRTGAAIAVSDYQREARTSPRLAEIVSGEWAAGLTAVPVRGHDRILGVLYAGLRLPGTLGPGLDGLNQLAALLGAALESGGPEGALAGETHAGHIVGRLHPGLVVGGPHPGADLPPPDPAGRPALSARERDILRRYADGLSTREVAAAEFLAVNTVRSYTQSALGKLGARHRLQAVAAAKRLGLI